MKGRPGADAATIRKSLLILTLVWAGMAAVSAGYAWVHGAEARLIAAEGRAAEAVVADSRISETRSGGRVDEDYFVTLRFTDAAGQSHEVEVEVTSDRHAVLPEGSTLTLRYAPSDPRVVEITPGDLAAATRRANIAALILGGVAVVFGAGWAMIRRPRGRRR